MPKPISASAIPPIRAGTATATGKAADDATEAVAEGAVDAKTEMVVMESRS